MWQNEFCAPLTRLSVAFGIMRILQRAAYANLIIFVPLSSQTQACGLVLHTQVNNKIADALCISMRHTLAEMIGAIMGTKKKSKAITLQTVLMLAPHGRIELQPGVQVNNLLLAYH